MEEKIGVVIGKRVLELREQRGLTQIQLAQAAGLPQGHISRLERGLYDDIQVSTLLELARALRVKPVTLLPELTVRPTPHRRRRRKRPAPAADGEEEAASMDIRCDDGSYYLGVWYVPRADPHIHPEGVDWLGSVWRAQPGGVWQGETRLRFYGAAEDGSDDKQWYTLEWPATTPEHEVLTTVTHLAGEVGTKFAQAPITVLIQGDGRAAWAQIKTRLGDYLQRSDLEEAP